ncbi:MAG: M20 family metallo-hydrolase [Thermodesulfobacteriota bacterium]
MLDAVLSRLDAAAPEVVALQRDLVAIPALGPANDGEGETAKAAWLLARLRSLGLPEVRELNAPDSRVPSGSRPNLAARIPGRDPSRTLWVIAHMDIVPAGDPGLWKTDPFTLHVDGDLLVGRGVEDNHQGLVSGLVLARAVLEAEAAPPVGLGLLLVSDEETGSKHGLDWVLANHPELFSPRDLILVPDHGQADSAAVEVAEKSMLWLKVTVEGRQCHASTPGAGVNSLVAAADFILRLRGLYQSFPDRDELFTPPVSTFEPTKKEANVPNVNTIPGKDVFYVDCRVLPRIPLERVEEAIRALGAEVEAAHGVRISYEPVQREQAAPATPVDSDVVRLLRDAIRSEYGVEARPEGIGGGTVAAFLRRRGLHAAVWATLVGNAHQPNEQSRISFTIGDAKVMARVLFGA